jgi:hypothetical protein
MSGTRGDGRHADRHAHAQGHWQPEQLAGCLGRLGRSSSGPFITEWRGVRPEALHLTRPRGGCSASLGGNVWPAEAKWRQGPAAITRRTG